MERHDVARALLSCYVNNYILYTRHFAPLGTPRCVPPTRSVTRSNCFDNILWTRSSRDARRDTWCVTSEVDYFDWLKKQPVNQVLQLNEQYISHVVWFSPNLLQLRVTIKIRTRLFAQFLLRFSRAVDWVRHVSARAARCPRAKLFQIALERKDISLWEDGSFSIRT